MKNILDYIESNKDRNLEQLIEFLSIPSVSSDSKYKADVERCGDWLLAELSGIGFENVRKIPTIGHPIVYADWLHAGENARTVLVYGHYDVQPVNIEKENWQFPPFKPIIHNGKIFARGTADDKGQLFTHVKALEAFFKVNGKLPLNVKIIFEGEEEASESNLEDFIRSNPELLSCDYAVVSDTEWFAEGLPSICYSLRGIIGCEIKITGPNRDVHSGSYGGAIDNPIEALAWIISQLKDRYGRVTIPGFYDDVLDVTDSVREEFNRLPFDLKHYCEDLEVKTIKGEIGYSTLERCWVRPALDINGIYGGYEGEGAKTIIPSFAIAKITVRLVPKQRAEEIVKSFEKYLTELVPPTVKVDLKTFVGGNPVIIPTDNAGILAAKKAMKEAFGTEPVFMGEGGSIPVVELFDSVLHANTILLGLGLPTDNIHSPNENFELANFFGGIKASALLFNEIAMI